MAAVTIIHLRVRLRTLALLAILIAASFHAPPAVAATCESLSSISLPNATITLAQAVVAGQFNLPDGGRGASNDFQDLPSFCRVVITSKPSQEYDLDTFKSLTEWKQSGHAPEQLIAIRYQNGKEVGQRLVCAYPRVAVYNGSGSAEDPTNFACKMPN
jgi:hypothetical protein